jgi:hypothetical protein
VKIPDRLVVKNYQVTSTGTGCERVTIVSCIPSTIRNFWSTSSKLATEKTFTDREPNLPLDPIPAQRYRVRPPEVITDVTDCAAAPDRKIIYVVNTHDWHVMKIMSKGQDPSEAFMIGLPRMFETVALS